MCDNNALLDDANMFLDKAAHTSHTVDTNDYGANPEFLLLQSMAHSMLVIARSLDEFMVGYREQV